MTDNNPNPNPNPPQNLPPSPPPPNSRVAGESGSNRSSAYGGQKPHYPNPPDATNPDAATLREQWRFAIKQYSRWYSQAWGTAILAGLSFFALGWIIKGSNPLPSFVKHEDETKQRDQRQQGGHDDDHQSPKSSQNQKHTEFDQECSHHMSGLLTALDSIVICQDTQTQRRDTINSRVSKNKLPLKVRSWFMHKETSSIRFQRNDFKENFVLRAGSMSGRLFLLGYVLWQSTWLYSYLQGPNCLQFHSFNQS
ncbi:unnamed protein product [Camellia sinensis]